MNEQDLLYHIRQLLKIINTTTEALSNVANKIVNNDSSENNDYKVSFSDKGKDKAKK